MSQKPVVIIGAGPSGLAAANELVRQGIQSIVLEKSNTVGGISRTEVYMGYGFDIGGHRFYTRIQQIQQTWQEMLPDEFAKVFRLSRIYFNGRFFNYPLDLLNAFLNIGLMESFLILLSYMKARIRPFPEEKNFEQWVANNFGYRLHKTFFQSYTEKVWGIPCSEIQADWAVQRIRKLSLMTALSNALFGRQDTRTLVDEFWYPVKGSGMMWERFREVIETGGGEIMLNTEAVSLKCGDGIIESIEGVSNDSHFEIPVEHVISSMPLPELIGMMKPDAPNHVREASAKLAYRAFIMVGLIVNKRDVFPDQWIYVHSPRVKVGRLQNFKNWSASMVPDPETTSVGMEYFCSEGDELWKMPDADLLDLASKELEELGLAKARDIKDGIVIRQPKAYPIYDYGYDDQLRAIRPYLEGIDNLQTIGRNGIHRYNNMDHSVLMGILAARNVSGENHDLWNINEEKEYLEQSEKSNLDQKITEDIIKKTFARIDKLAFATAVGAVSGLIPFIATIWLLIKGGEVVGPNLQLLSQYFIGYTVSVKGAFISFIYSFVWGFLFGWLFSYLRNFFFAYYIYRVKKKAAFLSLKDFFDYM
ncbi:MAG: NAD(P)/FAD-dependent oxidoreductase [Deltaproteobacteria bacterium]|nr:NAD(P)/FAD-dependent oxidoreductase [Deltaproteobacteria bacterium]